MHFSCLDDCMDAEKHSANCPSWANSGYCSNSTYYNWMSANCAKSCENCGPDIFNVESPINLAGMGAAKGCFGKLSFTPKFRQGDLL